MSRPAPDHVVLAIPTRDRPEMLTRCLASVAALAPTPGARVHVVVIDNSDAPGSFERTRGIAATAKREPPIEVVPEQRVGEAFVRNRALDEALARKADALVFLDDDQTVPEDWLATIVRVWREEGADVVETPVQWRFEGTGELREFFVRTRDTLDGPPRERRSKAAATNGVLVDARILTDWGLRFDSSFGLGGGADTAFFKEVHRRGGTQVLTRETFSVELCPREKETRRWILRRAFRIGSNKHQFGQPLTERVRVAARGAWLLAGSGALGIALWPARVRSTRALARSARGAGMFFGAFGVRIEDYRETVGR